MEHPIEVDTHNISESETFFSFLKLHDHWFRIMVSERAKTELINALIKDKGIVATPKMFHILFKLGTPFCGTGDEVFHSKAQLVADLSAQILYRRLHGVKCPLEEKSLL